MQRLPREILIDIFGRLEARDLLQVERVCTHWETLVDDNVWKKKRTITETDLDVHSPVSIQVDNFINLLRRLHRVDYYYFPFMDWIHKDCDIRGFCSESVLSRILQLETIMKRMLHAAQIPVHMNVLEFLEHLRIDRQKKMNRIEPGGWYLGDSMALSVTRTLDGCSIANCQSVITRYWTTGSSGDFIGRNLLAVLCQMKQVNELIIEKLYLSRWDDDISASLLPIFLSNVDRIRILEVVCDDYDDSICMSVRLKNTLFSHDEFERTLPSGYGQLKDGAIDHFGHLVDAWKCSRGIKGVTIGSWSMSVETVISALRCDSVPQPRHLQVLRQLLQLNVTSFNIQDTLCCGKLPFFTQLPRHVIEQTVHLRLNIEGENHHGQGSRDQMNPNEQMAIYDSEMLSVWNSVLDVMTLRRLKSLDLAVGVLFWMTCSRVLPSPIMPIHLPSLESIKLCGSVSLYHVVSLLLGVRNLRRLVIDTHSVEGEPMEQLTFKKDLLDVIERMTSLTTLHIIVNGTESCDSRWLEPWLTFTAVDKASEDETPSLVAHLREDVIQALSHLVQLESLILDFYPIKDFFPNNELDSAGLRHDEERLCSTCLPRLCDMQLFQQLSVEYDIFR